MLWKICVQFFIYNFIFIFIQINLTFPVVTGIQLYNWKIIIITRFDYDFIDVALIKS